MHSRVEEIATLKLQMQVPDAKRVQIVTLNAAAPKEPVAMKFEVPAQTQLGVAP